MIERLATNDLNLSPQGVEPVESIGTDEETIHY